MSEFEKRIMLQLGDLLLKNIGFAVEVDRLRAEVARHKENSEDIAAKDKNPKESSNQVNSRESRK